MRTFNVLLWTTSLAATAYAQALFDPQPPGNKGLPQYDSPIQVYTCPERYSAAALCCPGAEAVQCDYALLGVPGVSYDPEGPDPPNYCETMNPFCCGMTPQRMMNGIFDLYCSEGFQVFPTSFFEPAPVGWPPQSDEDREFVEYMRSKDDAKRTKKHHRTSSTAAKPLATITVKDKSELTKTLLTLAETPASMNTTTITSSTKGAESTLAQDESLTTSLEAHSTSTAIRGIATPATAPAVLSFVTSTKKATEHGHMFTEEPEVVASTDLVMLRPKKLGED